MSTEALGILRQTPAALRGLLAAAARHDLDWTPAPDRWSITQVLAHLADVEVNGFMSRFRAMVEREHPFLPSYDQLKLFESGAQFDGPAEMERFLAERARTLIFLDALPAGAASRTGRHEELGSITLAQLLSEFAFHDLGHIRQVAEIYRARVFYPNMGEFRRYYKVNP